MQISTAMIIDDSQCDQLLTQICIEKHNPDVKITKAFDGKEALEILAKLDVKPDIIFLDINMPGMDGLEFLKHYDTQKNQSTVIAMLTSSDQEKDKKSALAFDCVKHYFVKTLDNDDLDALNDL